MRSTGHVLREPCPTLAPEEPEEQHDIVGHLALRTAGAGRRAQILHELPLDGVLFLEFLQILDGFSASACDL